MGRHRLRPAPRRHRSRLAVPATMSALLVAGSAGPASADDPQPASTAAETGTGPVSVIDPGDSGEDGSPAEDGGPTTGADIVSRSTGSAPGATDAGARDASSASDTAGPSGVPGAHAHAHDGDVHAHAHDADADADADGDDAAADDADDAAAHAADLDDPGATDTPAPGAADAVDAAEGGAVTAPAEPDDEGTPDGESASGQETGSGDGAGTGGGGAQPASEDQTGPDEEGGPGTEGGFGSFDEVGSADEAEPEDAAAAEAGSDEVAGTRTSDTEAGGTEVTLREKNDSGVTGAAVVDADRVVATASGLDPDERYVSFFYGATSSVSNANPCILDGTNPLPSDQTIGEWEVDEDGEGALSAANPLGERYRLQAGTMSIRQVEHDFSTAAALPVNPLSYSLVACGEVERLEILDPVTDVAPALPSLPSLPPLS